MMLSYAVMAIEAGQCEVAVISFADNPKTGSAAGYSRPRGDDAIYGWFGILSGYAMIARRHMGEHRTRREHLAQSRSPPAATASPTPRPSCADHSRSMNT